METLGQESQKQTLVARGKAFYAKHLKTLLEPQHEGQFLAIEPDSGRYFLGPTSVAALDAARAAIPERLFYLMRVGYGAAFTIGSGVGRNLGKQSCLG